MNQTVIAAVLMMEQLGVRGVSQIQIIGSEMQWNYSVGDAFHLCEFGLLLITGDLSS